MTTLLIAVLGFVLVAGLGFVFAGGDSGSGKAVKRAQTMRTQSTSRLDRKSAKSNDPAQRRKQILSQLKDAEGRVKGKHKSTGIARPRFWDRARYYGLDRELAEALDAAE